MKKRLMILILIIVALLAVIAVFYTHQEYSFTYVDKLVCKILANGKKSDLDLLLNYRFYHNIDAAFSMHYKANLYIVYRNQRKAFFFFEK